MKQRRLLPRSSKEAQWATFTKLLDVQTPKRRKASTELRLLHRIFSIGAREHLLQNEKEDLIRLMYIVDRPDLDSQRLDKLRSKVGKHTLALFTLPLSDFKSIIGTMDIEFNPSIRGNLRSYGRRKINGAWETVHASHAFSMDKNFDDPLAPKFYGLSYQLDIGYQLLCEKYDLLFSETTSIEQKLLAESFLQLVGTRVLHPFFDGNGRTFIAHLTLMLEREGIRIREFNHIMDIARALSPIQNEFLSKFIMHAGLHPIEDDEHFKFHVDMRFRNKYMEKLKRAICTAVEEGIRSDASFFPDYIKVKNVIKAYI